MAVHNGARVYSPVDNFIGCENSAALLSGPPAGLFTHANSKGVTRAAEIQGTPRMLVCQALGLLHLRRSVRMCRDSF